LGLFRDELSNIGSKLIAMTLLHQENRVHRSAKAVPHQGKNDVAQGCVDDAFGTMPRLARKSGQWFALAEDLQLEAYLLRRPRVGPSLLSLVRVFEEEVIHKRLASVK
jgi:hypothetical protein